MLKTSQRTVLSLSSAALTLFPIAAQAADESKGLLSDTNFFVLIAFMSVMGIIVWAGVPRTAATFFRERAEGIRSQLDDARTIREDAQRLLADYQKRQREAEEEVQAIIDLAKSDAKIVASDARTKMEEQVQRRRKAAEDRIARAEAQAVAEMRGQTADLAIAAAREIIGTRLDDKAAGALVDRAIADVRGRLN